jgi:hypothetical protein
MTATGTRPAPPLPACDVAPGAQVQVLQPLGFGAAGATTALTVGNLTASQAWLFGAEECSDASFMPGQAAGGQAAYALAVPPAATGSVTFTTCAASTNITDTMVRAGSRRIVLQHSSSQICHRSYLWAWVARHRLESFSAWAAVATKRVVPPQRLQ